jgi:hypothetical protein
MQLADRADRADEDIGDPGLSPLPSGDPGLSPLPSREALGHDSGYISN